MSDTIRAEIDKGNRKFVDSFNNDDFDGVGSVYTDDGKVIPPGFDTVEGKTAVAGF